MSRDFLMGGIVPLSDKPDPDRRHKMRLGVFSRGAHPDAIAKRIEELEAALERSEAGRQKAEDDFNRLVQAFSETNAHQVVRVAELEQDLRMSEAGRIAAEEELAVVRQARQDAEEHLALCRTVFFMTIGDPLKCLFETDWDDGWDRNAYRKALAVLREEEAEVRARREAPCASEPDATTEGETP